MPSLNENERLTYRRLAVGLILIGLLFAFDSWLGFAFVYKLWPLIITVLGMGLIGVFLKRKAFGIIYLVVGEYLICFSGLALYLNFFGWGELGHLWPYFIYFLGITFVTLFFLRQTNRFLLLSGFFSLSLAILFLLVFSIGFQLWWMIFILLGLSILVTGKIK